MDKRLHQTKAKILARRKEIEGELADMLKETGSDFTLEDVKRVIYNEKDSDDLTKIIAMFDRGGDVPELENILDVVTDAWNYFPHKATGGLSPAEMVAEYRKEA